MSWPRSWFDLPPTDVPGPYVCRLCGASGISEVLMYRHAKWHVDSRTVTGGFQVEHDSPTR